MELSFPAICHAIASAFPDRVASIQGDRSQTWHEVWTTAERIAGWIRAQPWDPPRSGPRWESPHQRVALMMTNDLAYLSGQLGIYAAGAVPVNLNFRYTAEELAYVLTDASARAVLAHHRFVPLIRSVQPDLPIIAVDDGSSLDAHADVIAWDELPPIDQQLPDWRGTDHYLCYTGGTTGNPKGVLWTQRDFLKSALGLVRSDGTDFEHIGELVELARPRALRAFPTAPLMHGAAGWNAMSCWIAGGAVVLASTPNHFDPSSIWCDAERHQVTSMLIVGDSFALPLIQALEPQPRDLSALRHVLTGGAVLSPANKHRLIELIPHLTIVDVLGSTESGRQAISSDRSDHHQGGFTLAPTARVLDESKTRVLSSADNSIGWLAQSRYVPLAYLGDPEKTAATFPEIDGTRYAIAGDRARHRGDGSIELLGRESVCINSGGEKIFAEEVETILKTFPGISDAVVCGRPSKRWGQEVCAVVSWNGVGTLDPLELVEHCRMHLAAFKAPRHIVEVPKVHRTPSGKAQYQWAIAVVTGQNPEVE